MRAPGFFAATSAMISPYAQRNASASTIPSRTPPTSLLWVMSGERIFITTG